MQQFVRTIASGQYFEGPRWHRGRLYMVDSLARSLIAVTPIGAIETIAAIEGISGGMGVLPSGDLVVTSMFDRTLLVYRGGALARRMDLSTAAAGTIDDMISTPSGRLYVGDLGVNLLDPSRPDPKGKGRILMVDPDGQTRVVAEGLSFPNGIALSGDGATLVVAESAGNCLSRFDIASDGSLRKAARFGQFTGPDGVCIDADDCVWVSLFDEDAFIRVDLDGRERDRLPVADERAIACALGGEDRKTLFALTADTTHETLMLGKSRARLIAFSVDVAGTGAP